MEAEDKTGFTIHNQPKITDFRLKDGVAKTGADFTFAARLTDAAPA